MNIVSESETLAFFVFVLLLVFAVWAWKIRAVTARAAVTGVLLSLIVCLAAGPMALTPIVVVFLLTLLSTRIGQRKKQRLGTAEPARGRNATQILANVSVPAICTAPLLLFPYAQSILLAGAAAALAEAAGDTVSSELGQTFGGTPRLIVNARRVTAGVDGAITPLGTFVALLAILLVVASCLWAGLLRPQYFLPVVLAAFVGTLVDSLLGATLERPGRLGNNAVNFTSTACAAALAILTLFARHWI